MIVAVLVAVMIVVVLTITCSPDIIISTILILAHIHPGRLLILVTLSSKGVVEATNITISIDTKGL